MENLEHVANAISSGNCALVSDGFFSKSPHQAAAAWVIGMRLSIVKFKVKSPVLAVMKFTQHTVESLLVYVEV